MDISSSVKIKKENKKLDKRNQSNLLETSSNTLVKNNIGIFTMRSSNSNYSGYTLE